MPFIEIEPNLLYHYGLLATIDEHSKYVIDEFLKSNCDFSYPGDDHSIFWLSNKNGDVYCMLTAINSSLYEQPIIEIYNVCSSVNTRRQGYTKKLLQMFQLQHPHTPLWLGVLFENKPAFKLYTSLGFTNPVVTCETPSGGIYPYELVTLMYTGPISESDKSFTLATVMFIHKKYNKRW